MEVVKSVNCSAESWTRKIKNTRILMLTLHYFYVFSSFYCNLPLSFCCSLGHFFLIITEGKIFSTNSFFYFIAHLFPAQKKINCLMCIGGISKWSPNLFSCLLAHLKFF